MQYTQDYDEKLPRFVTGFDAGYAADGNGGAAPFTDGFMSSTATSNWLREIYPYVKNTQMYRCPSATPWLVTDADGANRAPTASSDSNYFGNGAVLGQNIARIPESSKMIYTQEFYKRVKYCDSYPHENTPGTGKYYYWHAYDSALGTDQTSSLHFDGCNLLCCDGHVKWRKYTSLSSGDFGLKKSSDGSNDPWSTTTAATLYDLAY